MPDYKYGILLQGRFSLWTKDIISEYKESFPDAHIVLSTWNTEDVSEIDCDVVQSELPSPTYPHKNTTNHQIIGVNAGLKRINSEIILKCRTDQIIHNKNIFELFDKNCSLEKIMIPDVGTTSDDDYRASDYCQIATNEVLNNFWKKIPFYDGKYAISPEIYLAKNYIVNFMKDKNPWSQIINKYFHVMKYHTDFEIEFEKLGLYEKYFRTSGFRVTSHFIQSQKSRVEFSKKYLGEKILLSTHGINTQYASSKSILESNCKEVWHRKNFENELIQRKFDSNRNIKFDRKEKLNDLPENSFDSILSFEEVQFHNEPDLLIKNYKKLLKSNGNLIISVRNYDSLKILGEESEEIPSFSKERFFKNIEENLSIIGTYYQGVLLNDLNPKGDSKTKTKFKKILDKLDSRMIFYRFYLQPTILKLREKGYEKKRIDFTPTYLDDEYGTPLYFLVIAKKI